MNRALLACVAPVLLAGTALAGPGTGVVRADSIEVELVTEHKSVQPGGEIHAGIRMKMDFGWHVYWRNPGDSGLPPTIKWSLPEGFVAGPIQWPAPHRIPIGGLVNYGYEGEVLLPVTIKAPPAQGGDVVRIAAKVDWQICEEICILGEAELELPVRVSKAAPEVDDRWRELFARTRRALPQAPPAGRVSAAVYGDEVELRWNGAATRMVFFPASDGMIENAAEQLAVSFTGRSSVTQIMLKPAGERTQPLARVSGVVVIGSADARAAYAIDVPVGEPRARETSIGTQAAETTRTNPDKPRPFTSFGTRHLLVLLGGVLLGFVLIWAMRKRGRPAG
ncbi:MAG: protein-disulfide reductase DsbD family protein [Planctomycetota bacterium]|nr:protein-disulfide reductase DsbD family protein [Planctomycetota bacterium]